MAATIKPVLPARRTKKRRAPARRQILTPDSFFMASLKQIQANRLNAQRSTGPRSTEGKAKSRFNALKSGIDVQLVVILDEDPAKF